MAILLSFVNGSATRLDDRCPVLQAICLQSRKTDHEFTPVNANTQKRLLKADYPQITLITPIC
ncbi:hypothetical protein [Salinisphaera sp.]|uniref:hypothetical protein n=1 Tax=Salinisphaera sp. TaxID=1914330 RepID=UPI0025E6B893|nr:hypothetical protein [Salinisphaera sp.]